eukprot:m.22268 g.22268  ORF g.22268 m.22268 type:complete len:232 (+) comp8272_c0_seq2:753-1448(+)
MACFGSIGNHTHAHTRTYTHAHAHALRASGLGPQPRAMLAKRSKRCKTCEHNLIKPELSPVSIKFKMSLFASLSVPTIRLLSIAPLRPGQQGHVVVVVSNPLDQAIDLALTRDPKEEDEVVVPMPRTAEIVLPDEPIHLPEMEAEPPVDAPEPGAAVASTESFVVARHRHTAQLCLPVNIGPDTKAVQVSFVMRYSFKPPPVPSRKPDEPAPDTVCAPAIPVVLSLGPCVA